MSAPEPIGTVLVETRDGKPVVLRADPHILVSAQFLVEYEGAQGNALVLPDGTAYVLGEYEPGRAVRHAYRTGNLAPEATA